MHRQRMLAALYTLYLRRMWAEYKRSCGWPASVGCGRFLICVSFAIALVSRLRSYAPPQTLTYWEALKRKLITTTYGYCLIALQYRFVKVSANRR